TPGMRMGAAPRTCLAICVIPVDPYKQSRVDQVCRMSSGAVVMAPLMRAGGVLRFVVGMARWSPTWFSGKNDRLERGDHAHRLTLGISGNPQDAEEAVQDAFWNVVRKVDISEGFVARTLDLPGHHDWSMKGDPPRHAKRAAGRGRERPRH